MENKYLKAKSFKMFIQTQKQLVKQANEFIDKSGIELCGVNRNVEIHTYGVKSFYRLADTLRVTIMKESGYNDNNIQLYFYYEGAKVFCIASKSDSQVRRFDYIANTYRDEFAKLFLETDDKEKAFLKLKDKHKNDRCDYLKYFRCCADLQKYLKRHSSQRYDSKEDIESRYLGYKNNFEPIEEGSMTWKEAERKRPNEDYFYPLSFHKWCKANY